MKKYQYVNPVVRGMYPDPSVCKAGDYFYLVNSTFEFFPAIPVFRSRNLVNWEQIGHCVSESSQLKFYQAERQSASGIYAPSIRYNNGTFYMVVTNMGGDNEQSGNFYQWTKDPAGRWSDPVFINTPGIDPSFFFDEDGKEYYIGTANHTIYITEIDLKEGKLIGETHNLWTGTGGAYPEGPHIYKNKGYYYLLISEGGTERAHMITMARSKDLFGPYEECPYNPVLTNRSLMRPIEAVGHSDLVCDDNGNWWAVCLGTRTFSYPPKHNLGRETMLVPVDWSGDWPVFGNNGSLDMVMEGPLPNVDEANDCEADSNSILQKSNDLACDFADDKLSLDWNYIYNPQPECYKIGGGKVSLLGNDKSISDMTPYTWLGIRQRAHEMKAGVWMDFAPCEENEEAGLSLFMNYKHHYDIYLTRENGKNYIAFRRQIGSIIHVSPVVETTADKVYLEVEGDKDFYSFYYTIPGGDRTFIGKGETVYITTEVGGSFTGNYISLFAMGNGKMSTDWADFTDFKYIEL